MWRNTIRQPTEGNKNMTDEIQLAAPEAAAPEAAAPEAHSVVDVKTEIHQHLDDMEKAIQDFGSAGGHVLTDLINLIRSKL